MLATTPLTITGPATVNIFTHKPKIKPSRLYSIAGDAIEFAKPVIGIIVPAPANFAMSSNTPSAVKKHAIKIKTTNIQAFSSLSVN